MCLAWALVAAGCGSNSSSASTSSSSSRVDPLALVVSVSQTTVQHGTVLLTPQVSFDVQNAQGEVAFTVRSEPAVDWFEVQDRMLSFAGQQRADYDAEALADGTNEDGSKSIELTVTVTDAGRSEDNVAMADVTVLVVLPDFSVSVSPSTVRARDGLALFSEFVLFAPSNARGAVSYELLGTSPAVDWFDLDAEGLLHFAAGEVASYDALTDVDDAGEGRPVVLTVRATDAGPPERQAMVELTVNVLPPPFELSASPSAVTIDSGSNRLNALNQIEVTLDNPQYLLGQATYAVSTDLEGEWFAIRSSEVDARHGVLSLARVLDYAALDSVPQTEAGRLLQVRVQMEDSGRMLFAAAEQMVDVVVTLRPQVTPLALDPSTLLAEVTHGESVMLPEVRFTPNALGTMTYDLVTEPAVDWFTLREEGLNGGVVLAFAEGKTASYDALMGLADAGVRSVTVIVTGTDGGRLNEPGTSVSENRATSSVTLLVHQRAVTLNIDPAETVVVGGETELNPSPSITKAYAFGRVRYSIGKVTPAVDWFAIDAATGAFSLTRPANYLDPALGPPEGEDASKRIEVTIELEALDRPGESTTETLVVRVQEASSFSLVPSRLRARVDDGSTVLSAPIQFVAQGPIVGVASYTVVSTIPLDLDWFAVDDDGELLLQSEASYEALEIAAADQKSVAALNGVRDVQVTVSAEDGSNTRTATVTVEVVRSAEAFHLQVLPLETAVRHGETTFAQPLQLSFENAAGIVEYGEVSASPAVDWFSIGENGQVEFAAGQKADYDNLAVADFGSGKPILLTLSITDTSQSGGDETVIRVQTTARVFVLPPLLTASIDPSAVELLHSTRGVDTGLVVQVSGTVVGALEHEVLTEPATDWFGVKPSSGAIYVRIDRALDWNALEVEADANDGSKTLSLRVRVLDQGRVDDEGVLSASAELKVLPAPLAIYPNRASASVDDGASDETTTIRFYSEAATGTVTYSVAGTSPAVDWFTVDGDGDLLIASEKTASYTAAALDAVPGSEQGKAVYVSVKGCDGAAVCTNDASQAAFTSVIILVKPPPFRLGVSTTEVFLQDGGIVLEPEVVFTPAGAVGIVQYELSTDPEVDWFQLEDHRLTLAHGADVRIAELPTSELKIRVEAADSGRSVFSSDAKDAKEIIVRFLLAAGVRIELNATRAAFFEKGGQLEPSILYEVKDLPQGTELSWTRLEGDTNLCGASSCQVGLAFAEAVAHDPLSTLRTSGSLVVIADDANFWRTKTHYGGRGDDASFPLYLRASTLYRGEFGEPLLEGSPRTLLFTMKNRPNDERITDFVGGSLAIPAGEADDLFFFPISQKLGAEATAPNALSFAVTHDQLTVRNVGFAYEGASYQIGTEAYGTQAEPKIGFLGWCAFRPCRTSGACEVTTYAPDWRLALKPGERFEHGTEPFTVSVTATIPDAEAGYATRTAEFTITIIERQDGTEAHPFIVDSADELRSLGAGAFRSDYTQSYCDTLPTCIDGSLAGFQTQVSHYLQTADIDLAADFERSIGALDGESAIAFHGAYDGGGYLLSGLEGTTGGLFDRVGAGAVLQDVHLREVNISGATHAGGLVNRVERRVSATQADRYKSYRSAQLVLPYYAFHFAQLWHRLDERETRLASPNHDFYFADFWGLLDAEVTAMTPPQVLRASVTGSVRGVRTAGGVVGLLEGGEIRGSYSTAAVEAGSDGEGRAGGLLGITQNYARVGDSFATGAVSSGGDVGGLVGFHGSGAIRTSFATGVPSTAGGAGVSLGALIGRSESGGAYLDDAYGLGLARAVGAGPRGDRIYGAQDGIEGWACNTGPLFWYPEGVVHPHDGISCAYYAVILGQKAEDFGWDYGAADEYPVPNYNVLTPTEIRGLTLLP